MEHLSNPPRAAKELYRVLKKGGRVFSVVPFMQPYHGYPHHYQNLTITGHKFLYENHKFKVLDSGTCVGPIFTAINLGLQFAIEYMPRYLRMPALALLYTAGAVLKPLDYVLHDKSNAHVFASTTYVIAEK